MPDGKVVSNTSPLFYLHQVGHLDLLRRLYERVVVPTAVVAELNAGGDQGLDVPDVEGLPWFDIEKPDRASLVEAIADLGAGEAGVLALGAAHPGSTLILDDRLGRQTAKLMGARLTGTLGVLLRAKRAGLVAAVLPIAQELRGAGMYISDRLLSDVARVAEEPF